MFNTSDAAMHIAGVKASCIMHCAESRFLRRFWTVKSDIVVKEKVKNLYMHHNKVFFTQMFRAGFISTLHLMGSMHKRGILLQSNCALVTLFIYLTFINEIT